MSFGEPAPRAGTYGPAGVSRWDRTRRGLKSGKPVLVYDASEGTTAMALPALDVCSRDVARLRNDAGGLLSVVLAHHVAEAFDLPLLAEEFSHPAVDSPDRRPAGQPPFSIPVNHRDTFTGITDADRALTITRLGVAGSDPKGFDFCEEFRTPGHVHVLKAAPQLYSGRQGIPELVVALTVAAHRVPVVAVTEMLDDETGLALSRSDATRYASEHGYPFVTERDVIEAAP